MGLVQLPDPREGLAHPEGTLAVSLLVEPWRTHAEVAEQVPDHPVAMPRPARGLSRTTWLAILGGVIVGVLRS